MPHLRGRFSLFRDGRASIAVSEMVYPHSEQLSRRDNKEPGSPRTGLRPWGGRSDDLNDRSHRARYFRNRRGGLANRTTTLYFLLLFAGFFAGLAFRAGAFFAPKRFQAALCADFAVAFFPLRTAGAFLRAARVFSANAAFSSESNSAGVNGRADLRSRSMS